MHVIPSLWDIYISDYCGDTYTSDHDMEWICGIIDIDALNIFYPQWQNNNSFFQIPVLVDVTRILMSGNKQNKRAHDDFKLDDQGKLKKSLADMFVEEYFNVFKYGNNRLFTRIWIHPNETQYIQPFGKYSSYYNQTQLLATPALAHSYGFCRDRLSSSPRAQSLLSTKVAIEDIKNDENEVKIKLKDVAAVDYKFDFYQENQLRVKDLNDYVIKAPQEIKYTSNDFKQLFENGKIVCNYYDDWNAFIPVAIIKRPHFKQYEFEVVYFFDTRNTYWTGLCEKRTKQLQQDMYKAPARSISRAKKEITGTRAASKGDQYTYIQSTDFRRDYNYRNIGTNPKQDRYLDEKDDGDDVGNIDSDNIDNIDIDNSITNIFRVNILINRPVINFDLNLILNQIGHQNDTKYFSDEIQQDIKDW